jgi:cellobiose transport system substrate-binding protein
MRHRYTRAARMAGVVAAAALLAAACSSSKKTSSGTGSAGSGGDKVTLRVGLFGTFGFKEAGLYDQYMKAHPNIKIVEDNVEKSQDYYKALQTHLAAGSGLDDVQGIEIGFVADIVANHANQFVDFNTLPNVAQIKSTFYSWNWGMATTQDGKTLGLGTDAGPEAMCYRPSLLKKAGLPSDRARLATEWSSWADFINFGKQYEAAAGKQANSHFIDSPGSIFSAAVYQGETAYADASGKPIPETSDGVKSAWQYASQAAQAKLTAGLDQFTTPWNQAFANGAFATISCPAWMLGYITSEAGEAVSGDWDVARLPGGAANWGGSWLGVPTASKHQKEAQDLVVWLTAPEQQVRMWTSQQHFPSSSTAAADAKVASATSEYFNNAPIGTIFGASALKLKRTPISPYDTQIQQAFTTALLTVATNGKSPESAWSDAMKNIKQIVGD